MTDVLFIITTLFVAYVVYVIVNEKRNEGAAKKPSATASSAPQSLMSAENKPADVAKTSAGKAKPAPVKATAKPATEKSIAKPAVAKAAAPAKVAKPTAAKAPPVVSEPVSPTGSGLKDPRTGEVATTYTNYRFTKRWIKEALVAEGLIDKIYKNDELNADVESKLRAAIAKLESIKKYQP